MNQQKITKQALKELRGELLSGQRPQKPAADSESAAKERSAAFDAARDCEERKEQELENEMDF